MSLVGRVALITGSARGIGAAIADRLAADGAKVAVADLSEAEARTTAVTIGGRRGVASIGLSVDVSSSASVAAAVARVAQELGPIDILVNNAGIDVIKPFIDSTEKEWDAIIAVNLKGPFICTRAVLDSMIERKQGRIINIASDAGRVGSSGEAVYSATKGGVIAFTKTIAREAARSGVTANVVCPGPTDTALLRSAAESQGDNAEKFLGALTRAVPLGRLGQPGDIAAAVAYFCSDEAGFVTGQTLSVSGGLTMQ